MPNTYSQLYIQYVFAVKHRHCLIPKLHKEELHKYFTGIAKGKEHKMLAVHAMPDHTHLFIGQNPNISISDTARDFKAKSSRFLTEQPWMKYKFNWQSGYGAFSYSRSHIDRVVKYIHNQEKHHEKRSFKDEYLDLLKKFEIEYEEKYLFEWIIE